MGKGVFGDTCDGCGVGIPVRYTDDGIQLCNVCFAETAGLHLCERDLPWDDYGAAVERCVERFGGTLWIDNGEYASQVNHCPYCGFKSRVEVDYEAWKKARGGVFP